MDDTPRRLCSYNAPPLSSQVEYHLGEELQEEVDNRTAPSTSTSVATDTNAVKNNSSELMDAPSSQDSPLLSSQVKYRPGEELSQYEEEVYNRTPSVALDANAMEDNNSENDMLPTSKGLPALIFDSPY